MINPWLLICYVINGMLEWLFPRPTDEQLDHLDVLIADRGVGIAETGGDAGATVKIKLDTRYTNGANQPDDLYT